MIELWLGLPTIKKESASTIYMQRPIEAAVRAAATPLVPGQDLDRVVELAIEDLKHLHDGNVSRYRLRLSEYRVWQPLQKGTMI